MKESELSLKDTTRQHWFSYFQTDSLLNIMFGVFGIYLLGYRIEFSCLYILPGRYFISTVWI